jgi:hypothetical protein
MFLLQLKYGFNLHSQKKRQIKASSCFHVVTFHGLRYCGAFKQNVIYSYSAIVFSYILFEENVTLTILYGYMLIHNEHSKTEGLYYHVTSPKYPYMSLQWTATPQTEWQAIRWITGVRSQKWDQIILLAISPDRFWGTSHVLPIELGIHSHRLKRLENEADH